MNGSSGTTGSPPLVWFAGIREKARAAADDVESALRWGYGKAVQKTISVAGKGVKAGSGKVKNAAISGYQKARAKVQGSKKSEGMFSFNDRRQQEGEGERNLDSMRDGGIER